MAVSSFVMVCVVFPLHTQDNRFPEIFHFLFVFIWMMDIFNGHLFFRAILGGYSFFTSFHIHFWRFDRKLLSFSFEIVRLYFFDDLLDEHSIDSFFVFLSSSAGEGG